MVVVNRANGGYSSALNDALKLARGEFIARMDADDISLPARFEKQLQFLEEHPDYVAVGTKAIVVDREGDPVTFREPPADHETIDGDHVKCLCGRIIHPTSMIRRQAIMAIGAYRPEFEPAEDLDLFLRLGEKGRLANLREFLLKYRLHDKNASVTRTAQQFKNSTRAVTEARRRRGLPPEWDMDLSKQCTDARPEMEQKKYFVREAIESGFLPTARKHAWRIWRHQPFSTSACSLLFRSLTGMKAKTALRLYRLIQLQADK